MLVRSLLIFLLLTCVAFAQSQEPQKTPDVKTEQQPKQTIKTQRQSDDAITFVQESSQPKTESRGDEATEFWTIMGRRLKVTDTLLVLFGCLLWWATRDLVAVTCH
jgi:hypothetical protein